MRTPITYYGGKQLLASTIVGLLPDHKIYCEPYFGGGAVFFQKPKSYLEVINDTNNRLITFFTTLRDDFTSLNKLINNSLHSEYMHKVAKDIYNDRSGPVSDLEMAWAVWMTTNGSFGASIYGGWKWCNGTAGSHSAIYMRGKREELNDKLADRVKDVQISCRDAVRVIKDRDTADTVFYLDPPYPGCEQQHYRGYTIKDLVQLLDMLQQIQGKFILSQYWCQTIKYYTLKNNWQIRTYTSQMKIANLGSRQKRTQFIKSKTEILIMNFTPKEDPQQKFDFTKPD